MKKLIAVALLIPLVAYARTTESEKFVIFTEDSFKAVCSKDRSDCKCFVIWDGDSWKEFECPKPKKEKVEGK